MWKWFKRGFFILVVVCIVGYAAIVLSQCSSCNNASSGSPKADVPTSGVPTAQIAPYLVQTPSRVYYAAGVKEEADRVTIEGYYEVVSGKWQYREIPIVLMKSVFGKITVSKRGG